MSASTELAVRPQASLPAKIAYAKELANSGLLPSQYRRQPANILYALEYGEMLGLSPMAAITGVHVIEGKPSASAGLISALVRRAGHKLRVTGDTKSATCTIVRSDDPDYEFKVTWTLRRNNDDNPSAEEAQLLGKQVWKNFGASMLKARAITQCARDACEEALFGLHYTPEELGAVVDEEGNLLDGPDAGPITGPVGDGDDLPPAPPRIQDAVVIVTDEAWLENIRVKAAGFADEDAGRALWLESAAKARAGECTLEDAKGIQALLTARFEDLRDGTPEDGGAEAEVTEAETADATAVDGDCEEVPAMEEDEFTVGFRARLATAPDEALGEMQVEVTRALASDVIAAATASALLAEVGRRRNEIRKAAAA